jgi:hypothetical protein
MVMGPGVYIRAECYLVLDPLQIRRDEVTGQMPATKGTFWAGAGGAVVTEFPAAGIDKRQRLSGNGDYSFRKSEVLTD